MTKPARHNEDAPNLPVLYSFRRCPYAMRSRMAILYAGVTVELRDILLKDKPAEMVEVSPKATVPVLLLPGGTVLEESLDIMRWAFSENDPAHRLPEEGPVRQDIFDLIAENDGPFKRALDHYKYHVRFPEKSREAYRMEGEEFLKKLEDRLVNSPYLTGAEMSFADMAIFPFIRQFANSDRAWFDAAPYPLLHGWLDKFLSSDDFANVMKKRPLWQEGTKGTPFPEEAADGR
ncbi:MAG: glutathione S-transferase [Alphaproteobacteria bacterium]|nr:MAG: glutathione S-transferase [Alphaproteobacteria bacterium]